MEIHRRKCVDIQHRRSALCNYIRSTTIVNTGLDDVEYLCQSVIFIPTFSPLVQRKQSTELEKKAMQTSLPGRVQLQTAYMFLFNR